MGKRPRRSSGIFRQVLRAIPSACAQALISTPLRDANKNKSQKRVSAKLGRVRVANAECYRTCSPGIVSG